MASQSSPPPIPEQKDSEDTIAAQMHKDESGSRTKVPQGLQRAITDFEGFVKLVAENLRYGSWTRRIATVAGIAVVTLNPISVGKVVETFGEKELPKWYATLFWSSLAGMGLGAVGVAIATLPKAQSIDATPDENESGAIKGLFSFELQDAEIYSKLQRRWSVKECWTSVTSPDFRVGVLMGESGCGKSSLLKAGLLPRLLDDSAEYYGVYVKFGDREPVAAVRKALGALATGSEGDDLPVMLEKAVQAVNKPIVLLFDQFEQFFVQYKQQVERTAFINSLKRWYDSDLPVRVLIGIRGDLADRLTEIQKALGYSLGPREVFRLEKLYPNEAAAVLKVMAQTEGLSFDERFITELTKNELANQEDGQISPVDLQVLGWMIARQSDEELRAFDQRAFQQLGGVEGLLQRFLERMLKKRIGQVQRDLALKVLLALTDRERNVRAGALSLEELQHKLKESGTALEISEAVGWLARSDVRLIATVDRHSERRYELAHERLISALLRVAKRELSEREQANQLLDRRVNEWLGNGKSQRYLFSWKELRLLQRYRKRGAIVWGTQRQWKEQLLLLSQKRLRSWIGIVATPLMIAFLFYLWSRSTSGAIQWTRWQLLFMARREEDISFSIEEPSEEDFISMESALTADLVTGVRNNPFPQLWIRWLSLEEYHYDSLSEIVKLSEELDSQATKHLLEQVYEVARASRKISVEIRTMADISVAYANIGELDTAEEVLTRTLELVDSNEYSSDEEIGVLTSIAEAAGRVGESSTARKALAQAIESPKLNVGGYMDTVDALASIAEAAGRVGESSTAKKALAQAIEFAELNDYDISRKVSALTFIARAAGRMGELSTAEKVLAQTLELTELIEDEQYKIRLLSSVVKTASSIGSTSTSEEFSKQNVELTESIEDDRSKARALTYIAAMVHGIKEPLTAKEVLAQAIELAKSIENDTDTAHVLTHIAEAANGIGELSIAKEVLAQAIELARSTEDDRGKAFLLISIAEAANGIGELSIAKEVLAQAIELARSTEDDRGKAFLLISIAETANSIGESSIAREKFSQAFKLAQSTEGNGIYHRVLGSIVAAADSTRESSTARELLIQAIELAELIDNDWDRAYALTSIAQSADNLQEPSTIEELLSRALRLAESTEDSWQKVKAIENIAKAYIEVNNTTEAKKVLREIPHNRRFDCALSKTYSQASEFGKAFRAAQRCPILNHQKARALAALLTLHAETINPELKSIREIPEDISGEDL